MLPIYLRDRGQKKDTHRLNVRRWENTFHANGNEKKAGTAILILEKIDIKTKTAIKDKKEQHIMIKGSIQEEASSFKNICETNI